MKIMFVGQNPKKQTQRFPFDGTRSLITLNHWLEQLPILPTDEIYLANAHTRVGKVPHPKDADGMDSVFWHAGESAVVVALGAYAALALENRGIRHVRFPHPSGLNRKINDQTYMHCMLNFLGIVISAARNKESGAI